MSLKHLYLLHRAELTTGAPNIRLQLGMFTVYPAVGSVQAGSSVQVTVDMIAENPGFSEEVSRWELQIKYNWVYTTALNCPITQSASTLKRVCGH